MTVETWNQDPANEFGGAVNPALLALLQCPICGGDIQKSDRGLICDKGHSFQVVRGISRFVALDDSHDYDKHWQRFSDAKENRDKLGEATQFIRWLAGEVERTHSTRTQVFLDVGCGDGRHLDLLPRDAIKIAIDYSYSVNLVADRYKGLPNLYVLQADAQRLPIKNGVVDCLIACGCYNLLPEPSSGLHEAQRVLKKGGIAGVWGYGTHSALLVGAFRIARFIYRLLPGYWLRQLYTIALIPSLLLARASTGTKPGKNSIKECLETISTNLSPDYVHVLHDTTWRDIAPEGLEYLDDYVVFCGQKFRRI